MPKWKVTANEALMSFAQGRLVILIECETEEEAITRAALSLRKNLLAEEINDA